MTFIPFTAHEKEPLFFHLLESKTEPDVLVRLWDAGVEPTLSDLERGVPRWLRSVNDSPAWPDVITRGNGPSLDWDLGESPERLPLKAVSDAHVRAMVWREHALVRMVRAGLDPELLLVSSRPTANSPETLLEWAHSRAMPFLVQECLRHLTPERRAALMGPTHWSGDHIPYSRVSYALAKGCSLLAQVWVEAGAPVAPEDSRGETPLFYCKNLEGLKWALAQGMSMSHRNHKGGLAYEAWEQRVVVGGSEHEDWLAMQKHVQSLGDPEQNHFPEMLEKACLAISESKVEELWKVCPETGALPSGHTAVGMVLLGLLQTASRHESWVAKNANKILAFLLPRADMQALATTPSSGITDAQLLGMCLIRYESNLRLTHQRVTSALKKSGRDHLPSAPLSQVLAWSQEQGLNRMGQENLLRVVAQGALGDAQSLRETVAQKSCDASLDPEIQAMLGEGTRVAQSWSSWAHSLLSTPVPKGEQLMGRETPVRQLLAAAHHHLSVWQETGLELPGSIHAWSGAVFAALDVLHAQGHSLQASSDCPDDYQNLAVRHLNGPIFSAGFGALMVLSEHPDLQRSPEFWARASGLVSSQDHVGVDRWVRLNGLDVSLPAAGTSLPKPRF
jgi:hypothetical protein